MKAIIHAINDDNVPGLQHLLGSLNSYDVNQPNKVTNISHKNESVLYSMYRHYTGLYFYVVPHCGSLCWSVQYSLCRLEKKTTRQQSCRGSCFSLKQTWVLGWRSFDQKNTMWLCLCNSVSCWQTIIILIIKKMTLLHCPHAFPSWPRCDNAIK